MEEILLLRLDVFSVSDEDVLPSHAYDDVKNTIIGDVLEASQDKFSKFDFFLTVPAGLGSVVLASSQLGHSCRLCFQRSSAAGRVRSAAFMLACMVLAAFEAVLGIELAASAIVGGLAMRLRGRGEDGVDDDGTESR